MGEVMFADQLTELPSTLPLVTGWELPCACCMPVRAPPLDVSSSLAFCAPSGELMVISQLPSMAMLLSLFGRASKGRGLAKTSGSRLAGQRRKCRKIENSVLDTDA